MQIGRVILCMFLASTLILTFVSSTDFSSRYAMAQSPNFTLTSPSAGAMLTAGSTVIITWTGGDPTWSVDIYLIDIAAWSSVKVVASSIPNSGSYTWTIPTTLPFNGPCDREYQFTIKDIPTTTWTYGPIFKIVCGEPIDEPVTCGVSNPNLYVSAENPMFSNTIAGPMVTEVVVCDSDVGNLNLNHGEPDVTVNGRDLRMIQTTDGYWYGYFADVTMAQQADEISRQGPAGTSLDFGYFCDKTSSLFSQNFPPLTDTMGFAIPVATSISGSQGNDPLNVVCSFSVNTPVDNINNVVREPPTLNPGSSTVGLGNMDFLDANLWPFVQLYALDSAGGNVSVQYNKGGFTQTVQLTFDDSAYLFASLTLDSIDYAPGTNVLVDMIDVQLNIDPTDEDSWTWGTLNSNSTLFYDLFDEDGNPTGDGIQTLGQNIIPSLSSLMFVDNGKLILDKDPQGVPVVQLETNGYHDLDPDIDGATQGSTVSINDQPVTFTEQDNNSGIFVNYDQSNNANIDTRCDAPNGFTSIIDYNALRMSIMINNQTCATGMQKTSSTPATGLTDIEVTKSVDNLTPSFGDQIQYNIVVRNLSPIVVTGIEVTDVLPPEVTLVGYQASQGTYNSGVWYVGTLNPFIMVNMIIDVIIDTPNPLPSTLDITNTATLTALDQIDPYAYNNSGEVVITASQPSFVPEAKYRKVPPWIQDTAKWWSEGQIEDADFVGGIQYMIKEKIIDIPDLPERASATAEGVPPWVKNAAGWWADGLIPEADFINGLKWMVEKGIIRVN